MIKIRNLDDEDWYCVTNDNGDVLIYTTSSAIAYFVDQFTPGLNSKFRLNVGGDPAVKRSRENKPIFHHIKRK